MKDSKIFQHNSYKTLSGGFYEGTITWERARTYGNIGIGTLDKANGEVTILDGIAYHGDSQMNVRELASDEILSYVSLLEHQPFLTFEAENLTNEALFSKIVSEFPTENTVYSIKITGIFKNLISGCKNPDNTGIPYPEVFANQAVFEDEEAHGTMVGLWSPEFLADFYGNGPHLHFISDNRKLCTHVIDFETEKASVEIGMVNKLKQEFSLENENFRKMDFSNSGK